ncbi:hypothetical protein EJB05_27646, partial [Eragrostis curvula]
MPTPMPMPAATTGTKKGPPAHCPSKCGDVNIPFPFGIGEGCPWRESFAIHCNHSYNPPRPYYRSYEVIDVTLNTGEMRVVSTVAHICYNSSNTTSMLPQRFNFTGSPFLISPVKNEFTAIGCHTVALLWGKDLDGNGSYLGGCVTTCKSPNDAASDGDKCTGRGCCQMPTPSEFNMAQFGWRIATTNPGWNSSCSYAFVAEKGWYHFHQSDLNGPGEMDFQRRFSQRRVPLVLNWAISTNEDPCFSNHSERSNVTGGGGYLCNCSNGYAGNPYSSDTDGCKNIVECELDHMKYCPMHSKCIDIDGGYDCKCSIGRRKIGEECRPIISTAISATVVAIIMLALILWFGRKKYKRRIQRGCFNKNGGDILKRMNINTFTELQLEKITNNYNNPIGSGAFGKVFLGTTNDNRRVAVKRSIVEGENPWKNGQELANEIAVQFWISHANLVRLVGCCLETDVPMLVYEYVSNGSLYNVLHGGIKPRVLSLPARLDIAVGSAKALAHMHSHGGHNLVHGDVKTGNILLGDNLTPKVSDFGTSKLASIARHANWCVIGDMSYIDPAYIKTGRYTEKSDVYSFGVVLLELITRKKAKYDRDSSLPIEFVKTWKEKGNGREMYDADIFSDGNAQSRRYAECLDRIGALAVQCLKEDVDERPTMIEVVGQLKLAKLSACGGSCSDASERLTLTNQANHLC